MRLGHLKRVTRRPWARRHPRPTLHQLCELTACVVGHSQPVAQQQRIGGLVIKFYGYAFRLNASTVPVSARNVSR